MVSVDVLLGRQADVPQIDVIVAIVDATNLERNLYLFTQLRQLNRPIAAGAQHVGSRGGRRSHDRG